MDEKDKEYRTKTGRVLNDEDIQGLADEAEKGYDINHLLEKKNNDKVARTLAERSERWKRTGKI